MELTSVTYWGSRSLRLSFALSVVLFSQHPAQPDEPRGESHSPERFVVWLEVIETGRYHHSSSPHPDREHNHMQPPQAISGPQNRCRYEKPLSDSLMPEVEVREDSPPVIEEEESQLSQRGCFHMDSILLSLGTFHSTSLTEHSLMLRGAASRVTVSDHCAPK